MADVTPQLVEGRSTIVSYGKGGFRLSTGGDNAEGERVEGAIFLTPSGRVPWSVQEFTPAGFEALRSALTDADGKIEVLLIGSGQRSQFLPPVERQRFRDLGIVVDVMDTGAACRTFNVLMTEDRLAAVALLPVD